MHQEWSRVEDNPKEVMRRSRTTRHETLGNTAWFSFSVAVPDEIYTGNG